MAEATDRPTAPGETAPAPPAPPAPAGIPPASDVPFGGAEHREAYQPLSLLAIAGLVLAVLYGVVVCLGGVVAFYTRYRFLLLVLTALVPALAALLARTSGGRRTRPAAAVAGLALAGLYSAVGLFGLIGFSSANPWLLP